MQIVLKRYRLVWLIGGVFILLINTLSFSRNGSDVEKLILTFFLPLTIILGIFGYFYYERVYVYSNKLVFKSLIKKMEIYYHEVYGIGVKNVKTASGSDGIRRFYIIFEDEAGELIGEIPFGFFKNVEKRMKVLKLIKSDNQAVVIEKEVLQLFN